MASPPLPFSLAVFAVLFTRFIRLNIKYLSPRLAICPTVRLFAWLGTRLCTCKPTVCALFFFGQGCQVYLLSTRSTRLELPICVLLLDNPKSKYTQEAINEKPNLKSRNVLEQKTTLQSIDLVFPLFIYL